MKYRPPQDPARRLHVRLLCPVATPERRRVPAATARPPAPCVHQVSAAVEAGFRRRCRTRRLPMMDESSSASVRCPRRRGREGLLEVSDRADAGAPWRLAGLGDGVFSDVRRGSSELRHGGRLIPRENGLAVGSPTHHVAEASGFDFFQFVYPHPAE